MTKEEMIAHFRDCHANALAGAQDDMDRKITDLIFEIRQTVACASRTDKFPCSETDMLATALVKILFEGFRYANQHFTHIYVEQTREVADSLSDELDRQEEERCTK